MAKRKKADPRLKRLLALDADELARILEAMLRADVSAIFDDKGRYRPLSEWPLEWRQMVSEIKVRSENERSTDGGGRSWDPVAEIMEVKWVDKLKVLELLGKHRKVQAFNEKVEHSGTVIYKWQE